MRLFSSRPVDDETLLRFTRQLTLLLRAGLPLVRSLTILARQERPGAFRHTLETVTKQVAAGQALSVAFLHEQGRFSPIFCRMIQAGETGGDLPTALEQWTAFLDRSLRLKKKIHGALLYPSVVMTVAVVILTLLTLFIIPRFKLIFAQTLQGQPLPVLTQWVIGLSSWLSEHTFGLIGGLIGLGFLWGYARRNAFGRSVGEALSQRIPYISTWLSKVALARFSRTLGMLLAGGTPLPEALGLAQIVVGRRYWTAVFTQVRNRVNDGESLGDAMKHYSVFPSIMMDMITVGEASGELTTMLHRIAEYYEEEVDAAITELTTILEPVMIILLAVVVGIVVFALFAPIVGVMENIGQLG